jgi:hypothetical protein
MQNPYQTAWPQDDAEQHRGKNRHFAGVGRRNLAVLVALGVVSLSVALALVLTSGSHREAFEGINPTEEVVLVAHQLAGDGFVTIAGEIDPSDPYRPPAPVIRSERTSVESAYGPLVRIGPPLLVGDVAQAQLTMAHGAVLLEVNERADGRLGGFGFEVAPDASPFVISDSYAAAQAAQIARQLAAGGFAAAARSFDPLFQADGASFWVPVQWHQLTQAFGPVRGELQPIVLSIGTYGLTVDVPLMMSGGEGHLQCQFDVNGGLAMAVPLAPNPPSQSFVGISVVPTSKGAETASVAAHDLASGSFSALTKYFSPLAAKNWSSLTLKQESISVTHRLGHLDRISGVSLINASPAMATYEIGLTYRRGSAHAQIGIDSNGQIASIALLTGPPTWRVGR